ncbi:MAG: peroxiredoxin [Bacteroidetes bacterium]|nr:peroxiredoxin [Bacteroidota bacterium]
MKPATFISALLFLMAFTGHSQDTLRTRIPLIGETAPSFTAESTNGALTFPDNNNSKWTILFSHPADFTPVCSSEILELAAMQEDFEKLNTRLMVISTDAVSSHIEWIKSLESVKYKGKETNKIKFPLISDKNLSISRKYGMLQTSASSTKDVRGVFIINPEDKIAAIFFYPLNIGRNMDEIKRTLIALQTAEKYNVLIPANWTPGQDVMIPSPKTSADAEKLMKQKSSDLQYLTWYIWFRKLP